MNDYNLLLDTDSYKASHWLQYPPFTRHIFEYAESRGGEYYETVFFGLQYYIQQYLSTPITLDNILEAEEVWAAHGEPFNKEGWMHILREHDGMMPVEIYAVPEGIVLPTHHLLANIQNLDPSCYWLPSHLETGMLRSIWYGTTVATRSYTIKKIIYNYLKETSDSTDSLEFRLHDFGARGVSSYESSVLGGMAHLVNFKGTDTIAAVKGARRFYEEPMAGFSIPAAEHSSITSWTKSKEREAYQNMLEKFAGKYPVVAIVSDSYDISNAVTNIFGTELKGEIEKCGSTIVVRPDSGIPKDVVLEVVERLGEKFGFSTNTKGYKVLAPCVRVIQGDGITEYSIADILATLKSHGWSAENVFFGMGGQLLQGLNRDTLKFAMKCSSAKIGDEWVDVYKDPITDSGKKSKRGLLTLYRNKESGLYVTGRMAHGADQYNDIVTECVYRYRPGRTMTLSQVRYNANEYFRSN